MDAEAEADRDLTAEAAGAPLLLVEGLIKAYRGPAGEVAVLAGASLALSRGESLALMGESGSGKSTLLHVVAGLEPADGGRVAIAGREIGALGDAERAAIRRDRIGIVFQQFNLIPSLDLAANTAFQARIAGRHDPAWCAHLIERLGLGGLEGRMPEQLSGGQQQRVAIGRAMALRPDLLLADEPTGNLDQETGERVLELMLGLVSETGCACLMVTHSARIAARLGRRLTLEAGRVLEGPAEATP